MRFDLIHPPMADPDVWRRAAGEASARGYTALLCPEVPQTLDPFDALAYAAGAQPGLRVGTHVVAAALHERDELIRRICGLADRVSGRFELGIGTGRPQVKADPDGQATIAGDELRHPIGLVVTLIAIGDVVAGWHARRFGAQELRDLGAMATLRGDPHAARETLSRWRRDLGITRVLVDPTLMEAAQPIVESSLS